MKKFMITALIMGGLFFSFGAIARTLDIIVGGANGGLECKADAECGPGKYCNQEQYYCVACKVPPKVWNGTTCSCPAGLVEKSETECVECLSNTDCTGSEQFCNTDTNKCITCKSPKEWNENVCACPSKTHESGDNCICDNPNTNLDEFNFCACGLTPTSCATTDLNLNECMCCPPERPLNIGSDCKTCAEIDPSKPVWDTITKKCVECQYNNQCPANKQCVNQSCSPCPGNQVRPKGSPSCACPAAPAGKVAIQQGTQCYFCAPNQILKNGVCVACSSCQKPDANKTACVDRCGSGQLCRTSLTCPNPVSFNPPQCVTIQGKGSMKKIQGVLNGKVLYIPNTKVSGEEAFRICEAYGMHLATIQEACAKDYAGDSGYSCPNIQGQFPEYAHSDSGDLWLNANVSGDICQLLRVTNSCGNNHYDWTTTPHYALCAE